MGLSLEQHDTREKLVMKFLSDAIREMSVTKLRNEKGNDLVSQRSQMIIIFSLIDVLANYWYEYRGLTGKPKEKAISWYENYCKTRKNEHYKKPFRGLDGEKLYTVRSSLVHFLGLGKQEDIRCIVLSSNSKTDSELSLLTTRFRKATLKEVHIIRPHDFSLLIVEGGIHMLEEWKTNIVSGATNKEFTARHIAGIKRVYDKIMSEGSMFIEDKRKEI